MNKMWSNLLRPLQLSGKSSGGILSHQFRVIVSGNSAGGLLPADCVKSQFSPVPIPFSTTAVRYFCHSRYPAISYEGMYVIKTPVNVGRVNVPEGKVFVIERFGKYRKTLTSGGHFLIPVVDKVAYVHSLKDHTFPVPQHNAITKDNIIIMIDGVVFVKIVDPILASYGANDPIYALINLAQACMRSELEKMTLDRMFEERQTLNEKMVISINEVAKVWGLQCVRYYIKDITPHHSVTVAINMQAEAERKMSARILESEGERQAKINIADGKMNALKLASQVLEEKCGVEAASLIIAKKCIEAYSKIEKKGLLPTNVVNPSAMMGQPNQAWLLQSTSNVSALLAHVMYKQLDQHPELREEVIRMAKEQPQALMDLLINMLDDIFDDEKLECKEDDDQEVAEGKSWWSAIRQQTEDNREDEDVNDDFSLQLRKVLERINEKK